MTYARGAIITLAAKGLVLPIGLVSSIITARYLGPEGRGILALLLVLQGIALQFGTLGFNASITYFLSRDKSLSSPIGSNAFLVASFMGLFTALCFFVAEQITPAWVLGTIDPRYLYVFLFSLPFVFYFQFFQNVFLAHQRIVAFNALDILNRAAQLLGFALVLVVLGFSTFEAVVSLTVTLSLGGFASLDYAHRIAPLTLKFDRELFRRMFTYGLRTYVASFLMFLVFRISLPMINSSLGEVEAGIFSIAMQIVDMVYIIPVTLGLVLFPKVSSDSADPGTLTAKVFRFSLVSMSALCFLIFLFAEPVIIFLYGEEFRGAVAPLQWLLPGVVALSLVTILNNDLAGRGLPTIVMIGPALGVAAIL
ncbi:MAG TPA: oligosaccharide flippase family protein, partial [Bacteroidota bacterium]